MPEINIKNVRDLIVCTREVKSLTEKTRKLDELQRALHQLLPSMLADYCQIRSYERGILSLQAETGSAATQLRFIQHQIFPKLKKMSAFKDLERITIRVQSAETLAKRYSARQANPVSPANCQAIRDTAEAVSDPGLAESLRRLAVTLGKYGKK